MVSRVKRKPTWGTCAGLILLAESATRTKKGGQELIGGLDVRVNRNYFGRQAESFEGSIELPFLRDLGEGSDPFFHAIFIRAPVVEKILPHVEGIQKEEAHKSDTIVAPSQKPEDFVPRSLLDTEVEVLATLKKTGDSKSGDVVAVRQGNCFGTSFHPELTNDPRIHAWWLKEVMRLMDR